MIPKTIHYCWFGGNPIPNDLKKCISSWEKLCPDYEIKRWDESNFDVNQHPFVKGAYEAKEWAFVSDYARLKIVYDEGGIYLDTDVELVKNLDFLLRYKLYIGVQQSGKLCNTGLGFGAEKENPIVKKMLDEYQYLTYRPEDRFRIACPYLNDKVFKDIGYNYSENPVEINGAIVFPCRYFDPAAPGHDMKNLNCNDTISIHHYSASWLGKRTRFRRKLIRLVGQERVNSLKEWLLVRKEKKNDK